MIDSDMLSRLCTYLYICVQIVIHVYIYIYLSLSLFVVPGPSLSIEQGRKPMLFQTLCERPDDQW